MQSSINFDELFSDDVLPALPQSAVRLLEMSRDPKNGPLEFAVPIEADAGMTGQVLRFVNSSFFGFAQEVTTVPRALQLVGIPTIKNFALWCAVFSLMPESTLPEFNLKALWQDSLRRGICARLLAQMMMADDSEEVFIGALLQDMAIPILIKQKPDLYSRCLSVRHERHLQISVLEKHALKMSHAEVGGRLARYWKLPERICQLIEQHTTKLDDVPNPFQVKGLASVVLSSMLPSTAEDEWYEKEAFAALYEKMPVKNRPELLDFLDRVDTGFQAFAPVLQISPNVKLLREYLETPESTEPSAKPETAGV